MRALVSKLLWLCGPILLYGQAPATIPEGLPPDWDVRVILQEMSAHATRLQPILEQVNVQAWIAKGASETYAAQLQSSKDQARTLADEARTLGRNPEKLYLCLQLFFRIHGLEEMIGSLAEGIRKYQDPALADTVVSLAAENGANRNRFQAYIVNLAAQREQECAVMDREAQRCRGSLAARPSNGANRTKKK